MKTLKLKHISKIPSLTDDEDLMICQLAIDNNLTFHEANELYWEKVDKKWF